jgi:hypothetical protein
MNPIIPKGAQTHLKDGTKINPNTYLFSNRPKNEQQISLWNDIRWEKARNAMSADQINQYKKIGHDMNSSIDYTNGKSNEIPIPKPIEDSLSYILVGLRSGLEPEDLSTEEITTLKTFIGDDWESSIFTNRENNTIQ